MFTRIEALNYRSLHYLSQELRPFQVLVGANASGKSTFLDVLAFMGDLVRLGPEGAVRERSANFQDLVWLRRGHSFELAVEALIPEAWRKAPASKQFDTIRYEVGLTLSSDGLEIELGHEKVVLKSNPKHPVCSQPEQFPVEVHPPDTLFRAARPGTQRKIVGKTPGGNDNFYSEVDDKPGKGWAPSFRLGPKRSALANLPADESRFPASVWLRNHLSEGVQTLSLNSQLLRRASPPGQGRHFRPDGSNLSWVIKSFSRDAARRADWIRHVQTSLEDVVDIQVVEREDDHHAYLVVRYANGAEVPSWSLSDGTLRLLALTLIGYLPDFQGCYLIEEPENGIHPRAVETVIQSLSSCYAAQILTATHSPVVLSIIESENLLCFAKSPSGATNVISGKDHPALRSWQGEASLGLLFAAGVLG